MHTNGPWVAEKDGSITSVCHPTIPVETICVVGRVDNQKLIAAAPEMFEILHEKVMAGRASDRVEYIVNKALGLAS